LDFWHESKPSGNPARQPKPVREPSDNGRLAFQSRVHKKSRLDKKRRRSSYTLEECRVTGDRCYVFKIFLPKNGGENSGFCSKYRYVLKKK
jgi:hypothetical protein